MDELAFDDRPIKVNSVPQNPLEQEPLDMNENISLAEKVILHSDQTQKFSLPYTSIRASDCAQGDRSRVHRF
jgi:hypothetical protein